MKSRKILFTSALIAVVATVSGCADSVLYSPDQGASPGPGGAPPPSQTNPVTTPPAATAKTMSVTLDADMSVQDPEMILFGDSAADPFAVNNSQATATGTLKLKTVTKDESKSERLVEATFSVQRKLVDGTVQVRDFVSDGAITLRNTGSVDVMEGYLRPLDGRAGTLILSASRIHSATAQEAAQNAWAGWLKVEVEKEAQNLARIKGFSE